MAPTGNDRASDSIDHGRVLFMPEPGACGGRLDPNQILIPPWLADQLDWHVWPSQSPLALSRQARTLCEHLDWERIWRLEPDLFTRRSQAGAPSPTTLWQARAELAEIGYHLCLDVELQPVAGALAAVIYGAGVVGWLADQAWDTAAPLLTTCASVLREPRRDTPEPRGLRPARPPVSLGKRPLPTGVTLTTGAWQVGDWMHTRWSYLDGPLAPKCPCPAHLAHTDFGPGAQPGL